MGYNQAKIKMEQEKQNQNHTTVIVNQVASKSNGVGTAGFVLALIAFLLGWIPIIGLFLGGFLWLLGLILSFAGVFRKPRGLAISGLIISLINIFILIFVTGAVLFGIGAGANALSEEMEKNNPFNDNSIITEEVITTLSQEDKIKEIKTNVSRIDAIKNWKNTQEVELEESEVLYFSTIGNLEKIKATYSGEESWVVFEYYLLNGLLSYVYNIKDNVDNSTYGEKEEVEYYFDNGKLIQIISSAKASFTENEIAKKQKEILGDFNELFAGYKKK